MNLNKYAVSFFLDTDSQLDGSSPDGLLFVYAPTAKDAAAVFERRMPDCPIDAVVIQPGQAMTPAAVVVAPAAVAAAVPEAVSPFAALLGKPAAMTDWATARAQSDDAKLVPDWAAPVVAPAAPVVAPAAVVARPIVQRPIARPASAPRPAKRRNAAF